MEPALPKRVKVELGQDGILRAIYGDGADVSESDAREVLAWVSAQCAERRRPLLADTSTIRSMDRGARTQFANYDGAAAVAVVVKSKTARVISNFFLGLNRPRIPMQMFSDEPAALEWLEQYL